MNTTQKQRELRSSAVWGKNGSGRVRRIALVLAVFAGLALGSAPVAGAASWADGHTTVPVHTFASWAD